MYKLIGNAFQLSNGALYAEKECGRQGRPAPVDTFNQFTSPGSNIQLIPGSQLLPQLLPNDNDNELPEYDFAGRGGNPSNCR